MDGPGKTHTIVIGFIESFMALNTNNFADMARREERVL